jgi:hypothetical protein
MAERSRCIRGARIQRVVLLAVVRILVKHYADRCEHPELRFLPSPTNDYLP